MRYKLNTLIIITFSFLLTSCYYKQGCWYVAQDVFCGEVKSVKPAQQWQKQGLIGRTDAEQRKQDFMQCGVRNYYDGVLDLNVRYEKTSQELQERSERVWSCMRSKGYILLHHSKCVDSKKNEYTGLCN